jgi:teichoic acid transport system permease protein
MPQLQDPARRRPIGEDLGRIWRRRHFMAYTAMSELRSQEMDTFLGAGWHLLSPALHISVYYVVFGLLLGTNRGLGDKFLPFLAIGVFAFDFMRKTVITGSKSLVKNRGFIESIPFPRATLPISAMVTEAVAYLPATIVMIGVVLLGGEPLTLKWAVIPAIFVFQAMFSTGLGLAAARITFQMRDFQNILPILFRFAFYLSGVLHLMEEYLEPGTLLDLVSLNPFYAFISLYRWAFMELPISTPTIASAIGWALVAPVVGYLWFRRKEREYGRE